MPREGSAALKPLMNGPASPTSPGKKPGTRKLDEEKLRKACQEFEAIFMTKLMKTMRQSGPRSGLFEKGGQQEIYQSLFDEEIGKSLAKRGGIGLGQMLYRNMTPQENRRKLPTGVSPGDLKPLKGRRGKEE